MEILQQLTTDLETFAQISALMGLPTFILLAVGLSKAKIKTKLNLSTPYIAVLIGSVLGLFTMIWVSGLSLISIFVGIINGATMGAAAVGYHVAVTKENGVTDVIGEYEGDLPEGY